jgi:hypothetical protein
VLVLVDILEELELRFAWPENQDLFGVRECTGDVVIKLLGVVRVLAGLAGPSVVLVVDVVEWSQHRHFVDGVWVDVEDVCFLVVEPHRNVLGHRRAIGSELV